MDKQRYTPRAAGKVLSVTLVAASVLLQASAASADYPQATLARVYPPGGQRGSTLSIELQGSGLDECEQIRISHEGIRFTHREALRFEVTIQPDVPVGIYDLQAVSRYGVSSTRAFVVSGREQEVEEDPAESTDTPQAARLGNVLNGCIGAPGDIDSFGFEATAGELVVMECWAKRIDSSLRAILELHGPDGERIAVNRGFFWGDPVIAYRIPADGRYVVKINDLVFSGGAEYVYRLDIHKGPRVVFASPSVLQKGVRTKVEFFGWNLSGKQVDGDEVNYEVASLEIVAGDSSQTLRVHRPSQSIGIEGVSHLFPGSDTPTWFQATTVAVTHSVESGRSSEQAEKIEVPAEISGRLTSDDPAWYSFDARRGEVFLVEGFSSRHGSPTDLTVNILSAGDKKVLAAFSDVVPNFGGNRFPTSHSDPAGRWTSPADGRYLIAVRDVTGAFKPDQRRVFRLSVCRDTSPFDVVAVGRRNGPSSLAVRRGGREMYDLIAVRRCGFEGGIHVRAVGLPGGLACPDVWFGPGVTQVPLVLTADEGVGDSVGAIKLLATPGTHETGSGQVVRGGTMVRAGLPTGKGRLTDDIPWSVAGDSPVRLLASTDRRRYSQGSVVEIEIFIDRGEKQSHHPVQLRGIGLPPIVEKRIGDIPSTMRSGFISFYLPPTIAPGMYTIAVGGRTSAFLPETAGAEGAKEIDVELVSNPLTFEVYPAPYVVRVNLDAPIKIKRGEVIQLQYTAVRKNGFIGKIHTDIAAPGGVLGIRARGVTFVGQTESGVLQVIANTDAPLGQQRGLRIEGVGTIEDEPVHLGGCFLRLEIVE